MKQGAPQFHTWPRWFPGLLTVFCGLLVGISLLLLSTGVTYGRYMTTGTTSVHFQAEPKPSVTVREGESEILASAEAETSATVARTFQVTCDGADDDTRIRVRLYAAGETAPSIAVQTSDHTVYTVTARALEASTMSGTDLGAKWVYIITDTDGNELLFDPAAEGLTFVIRSADDTSDIAQLIIRAEAVKES